MRNYLTAFVLGLAILFVPAMVHAEDTVTVTTEEELFTAVESGTSKTIVLGNDIETTKKLNVTRELTIDGAGHKITYVGTFKDGGTDNTVWGSNAAAPYNGGVYVVQAYRTTLTLKDITLTGGNVGLGVNGSTVTLLGTVNVSGNGFGGIEVSKGAAVTEKPALKLDNTTLVNTSESSTTPTVWVDQLTSEEVTLTYNGIEAGVEMKADGKDQLQFFVDKANVPAEKEGVTPIVIPGTEVVIPPQENVENPETADLFGLYAVIAVLGIGLGAYSIKKLCVR